MFSAVLFSSSDTFTGYSGVVVTVLNMFKTCQTHTSSAEVLEYVLGLKKVFFGYEHMKE